MSIKLVELYSLAIPIFMPSPKFFHVKGGLGPDRTSTSRFYCNSPDLEEKMRPGFEVSSHLYSPNIGKRNF